MKRCSIRLLAGMLLVNAAVLFAGSAWGGESPAAQELRAPFDEALGQLAGYEYGDSQQCITVLTDIIRQSQSDPSFQNEVLEKLTAFLVREATLPAKDFVCRQLAIVGTEKCVPTLAAMLSSSQTAAMARYALERMPYPEVDQVFLDALPTASGSAKVALINSLGERRCGDAVADLTPLVFDDDPVTTSAAVCALGKIGSAEAARVLGRANGRLAREVVPTLEHATLLRADRLRLEGRTDEAVAIYNALLGKERPGYLRAAAFIGKAAALGERAVPMVADALAGGDADLVAAAAVCVFWIPGEGATTAFAQRLPQLTAAGQVMLLTALANRRDPAALATVMKAIESDDPDVRVAAAEVIGKMGTATCVKPLAGIAAASTDRRERDAVRNALDGLAGAGVEDAMRILAKTGEPAIQLEVVRSLGARHAMGAVPDLLHLAGDQEADESVRRAAFKALVGLATIDNLPMLIDLLHRSQGDSARACAERVVVAIAKHFGDADRRAEAMLDGLAKAESTAAKRSMYRVLGQVGDEAYLDVLREAAWGNEPETRDAAIRALAAWPTPAALDDVVAIAENAASVTHRVLALRGLLRLLREPAERPVEDTLDYYRKAIDLAQNADEMKAILAGLAQVQSPMALTLVAPCLAQPELRKEAVWAAHKIVFGHGLAFASHNTGTARNAIDLDMDSCWSTATQQHRLMSFAIDLRAQYNVHKVILDNTPSPDDFPHTYQVFVSDDPADWHNPVAEAEGNGPVTRVTFAPKQGRFIVFVLQVDAAAPWSIHEVRFIDAGETDLGLEPVPGANPTTG